MSELSWFPCEHPERPNDPAIVWHSDCRGCYIAALATVRRWREDPVVARIMPDVVRRARPTSGNGFLGVARTDAP